MDTKTARALIATLKQAAQPATDPAAPAQWRIDRDRFIDLLDPSGDRAEFGNDQIRQLVQFLGDSRPTAASRHTIAEWHTQVDAATTRLLSLLS